MFGYDPAVTRANIRGMSIGTAMQSRLSRILCVICFLTPVVGNADQVDCKGASHWNSDHGYKKGDKVWHHEGGTSYYLYRCDQEKCTGAGDNEPKPSSSVWKLEGSCKDNPS